MQLTRWTPPEACRWAPPSSCITLGHSNSLYNHWSFVSSGVLTTLGGIWMGPSEEQCPRSPICERKTTISCFLLDQCLQSRDYSNMHVEQFLLRTVLVCQWTLFSTGAQEKAMCKLENDGEEKWEQCTRGVHSLLWGGKIWGGERFAYVMWY